jgi:hypothetical protein
MKTKKSWSSWFLKSQNLQMSKKAETFASYVQPLKFAAHSTAFTANSNHSLR